MDWMNRDILDVSALICIYLFLYSWVGIPGFSLTEELSIDNWAAE